MMVWSRQGIRIASDTVADSGLCEFPDDKDQSEDLV